MFDWNDLRYFLAVARHGSTIAAAKALKTSQSTVQRRLSELERRIGQPLVNRNANGYRLSEFGEQLLPHAERVEAAVEALNQRRAALERGEVGTIRLTCPEPIMARLKRSPFLDRFHERHPKLRVEFVMSDKYLDLARGDADVALRSGDTDDEVLVGRKVADSFWAVYGTPAYLAAHGKPASIAELKQHAMIGLDESMADHRAAVWLREAVPGGEIVVRATSVLGLVSAARSGIGLAPLPTALGDSEPELVQVLGPIPALTRSWRLLTHPDVRKTARVSAFFDFVNDEIETLRPILSG